MKLYALQHWPKITLGFAYLTGRHLSPLGLFLFWFGFFVCLFCVCLFVFWGERGSVYFGVVGWVFLEGGGGGELEYVCPLHGLNGYSGKASASIADDPGIAPRFLRPSHVRDLHTGILVATSINAWRYETSTGTSLPAVSVL